MKNSVANDSATMSRQQLVINLPDNVTLPEDIQQEQDLMRDAIAIVFYKQGRLSLKEARQLMGLSRREFEEILPTYGFSMLDENDMVAELHATEHFSS